MLSISLLALLAAAQPAPGAPAPPATPASADLAGYFTLEDYPAEARFNDETGAAGFRLTVGPDGRVRDCVITSTSGSVSLDEATCAILTARPRFTPARDARGNAVPDTVSDTVNWRLRDAPPEARPRPLHHPRPIAPLASLVTPADHPAGPPGFRGTTSFSLAVASDGRVTDCTILLGSGLPAADEAACRVMRERARFTPATDANGSAVADRYRVHVGWNVSAPGARADAPPMPRNMVCEARSDTGDTIDIGSLVEGSVLHGRVRALHWDPGEQLLAGGALVFDYGQGVMAGASIFALPDFPNDLLVVLKPPQGYFLFVARTPRGSPVDVWVSLGEDGILTVQAGNAAQTAYVGVQRPIRRVAGCQSGRFAFDFTDSATPPPAPNRRSAVVGEEVRASAPRPLAAYVTDEYYPLEALFNEEQGTAAIRLGVGEDGRVAGCTVTSSSGSPSLDEASCRVLATRAQFTPARSVRGDPIPDQVGTRIVWRLSGQSRVRRSREVAQRTRPVAPLASVFRNEDYPPEAGPPGSRRATYFHLDVAATGQVTACSIVTSSGSDALDAAACRIMQTRARFNPARDGHGAPVADRHMGHINWSSFSPPS